MNDPLLLFLCERDYLVCLEESQGYIAMVMQGDDLGIRLIYLLGFH